MLRPKKVKENIVVLTIMPEEMECWIFWLLINGKMAEWQNGTGRRPATAGGSQDKYHRINPINYFTSKFDNNGNKIK